jgi:L-threonylcarbamoyladenylate synthase
MSRLGSLDDAVRALRAGLIVGIPTDTVYGIATDPTLVGADQKLAAAKGRSSDVPLQVLVSSMEQAFELGVWSDGARRVARALWPGGLTLVVPRRGDVEIFVGGSSGTVGIRWPLSDVVAGLCSRFGPIAATSANLHGEPPLETAVAVLAAFGDALACVVDGGDLSGSASTVVDLTGDAPVVLREGSVASADVVAAFAAVG